jgi:hypothetical protein
VLNLKNLFNNFIMPSKKYPKVKDLTLVGTFPALAYSGGGYVWDDVLEYRVWCHPHDGAPDIEHGNDYYFAFGTYEEALKFSQNNLGCEVPIALILQKEYINEDNEGEYTHVKNERLTEWDIEFLNRPKRDTNTIPNFFSANAPSNRLDILRGIAKSKF